MLGAPAQPQMQQRVEEPVELQVVDLLAAHRGHLLADGDAVVGGGVCVQVALREVDDVVDHCFGHVSHPFDNLGSGVTLVHAGNDLQFGGKQLREQVEALVEDVCAVALVRYHLRQ